MGREIRDDALGLLSPARADLPVWLGALGPRMLALAGRIADGVILNLMTPAQAGQAAGVVRDAARAAGRDQKEALPSARKPTLSSASSPR